MIRKSKEVEFLFHEGGPAYRNGATNELDVFRLVPVGADSFQCVPVRSIWHYPKGKREVREYSAPRGSIDSHDSGRGRGALPTRRKVRDHLGPQGWIDSQDGDWGAAFLPRWFALLWFAVLPLLALAGIGCIALRHRIVGAGRKIGQSTVS